MNEKFVFANLEVDPKRYDCFVSNNVKQTYLGYVEKYGASLWQASFNHDGSFGGECNFSSRKEAAKWLLKSYLTHYKTI